MWEKSLKLDLTNIHQIHSIQIREKLTIDNEKELQKKTSESGQNVYDQSLFYTKQGNKHDNSLQISFQKGLMGQHKAVFKKSYQNCMEAMNQLEQNPKQYHSQQILVDSELKISSSYRQILMKQQFQLSLSEATKIKKQLSKHQKIPQFLDFVCVSTTKKTAIKLIKVTAEILQKSIFFLNNEQSSLEFISKGNQFTQYFINHPEIEAILRPNNATFLSVYMKFLSIFSTTVLLVAAKYFENPYFLEKSDLTVPKDFLT